MNRTEIRKLRGQLILVAILFGVTGMVAIVAATQRRWAEGFVVEKYRNVPEDLQSLINSIHNNQPIDKSLRDLSRDKRLLLYDYWMQREVRPPASEGDAAFVQQLMRLDADLYLDRAERTLVCGSETQQSKAVELFRLSRNDDAIPMLIKAENWARRRHRMDLARQIRLARTELEFPSTRTEN